MIDTSKCIDITDPSLETDRYQKEIVAYLPVLSQGYIEMFAAYPDADVLNIVDPSDVEKMKHLRKDVRALSPEGAKAIMTKLGIFKSVNVVRLAEIEQIEDIDKHYIMPDDEVTAHIEESIELMYPIEKYNPFLRWHRENFDSQIEFTPDKIIDVSEIDQDIVQLLITERDKSVDWWRRVSAVITDEQDGLLDSAHNQHQSTMYSNTIDGDPRMHQKKGTATEATTAEHAEAILISRAARGGRISDNNKIYVTTFPCSNCAKLIKTAGISEVFFAGSYASKDGYDVLADSGVKLTQINGFPDESIDESYRKYPEIIKQS